MSVMGCTYHRYLPIWDTICPDCGGKSSLCNTIVVSCLTSFKGPAGPHSWIHLPILFFRILPSNLFHTVLWNLGIRLLLSEAGHEKVGAESLKPRVLLFLVCQFCQVASLLLLYLSMSLNMRNNCEGAPFKSIKPSGETHCMRVTCSKDFMHLFYFYFHIHACEVTPLFSPEWNKVMLNVICHKAKGRGSSQSN